LTFKNLDKRTKYFLTIQAIGMLMGTFTHVQWMLINGVLSVNYNAPLLTKIFWDSLTFLDPIAAILLFVRPKTGLVLTLIIITVDVIHNNLFYIDELYINAPNLTIWIQKYWIILGQIIFALFVYLRFKYNYKAIKMIINN